MLTNANHQQYSPKWQFRFNFFDTFGEPKSPEFKEAMKQLPLKQKLLININWYAICFGFIYFFILGLWRKALSLLGGILVLAFTLGAVSDGLANGIGIAFSLLAGMTANYAYYLKETKGNNGWNPFEGMRW
ncbi:DUF2628 domain-containing protein [Paracidovorax konjaci]|uniref:DUF2628 domain-containing protein n=1 Tax=Paracidovorax konjaci TaxID=32040 RepID=A0A1I1VIK4_9BURK|nr:DUF2628 domain-containing protein [Paracidovorax konjaci]SFD82635.1 Protein of unknown function [Paracidovorax konjaci]